ncbi:DUF732 domain-containing protein [Mycolicibacterium diernhoferi]|uniref:DUF732 domain-containing protein n=1 Tax=Mycolicibacterium diernhoferi TaxID=1801 RepID=A0A1Q4H8J8_9MYCO|nr:DUF732 domain-containing protein [Mycolicibacterium diernhoferi]OJZ63837.1 hypothetical protein BRW64_20870 [Mycolicibacterium diernhoferi]OPE55222.1 hypothetical protein BV510_06215 [Mycolicibacterium diernhoferi]PEG54327.1 DUF732 domain-containing protein [Mycolicibacterium diernhoferi]QYL25725.1 DUF732 domain-containing protein [Mycolicibacterium diernhoferi]
MMRMRFMVTAAAALSAGLLAAAPAQADPAGDFLNTLDGTVLSGINPADAISAGQSVCPMLADGGQDAADVAGRVADTIGRPLGPATMFTGFAISAFCPGAVASIANGESPIPLGLLGF